MFKFIYLLITIAGFVLFIYCKKVSAIINRKRTLVEYFKKLHIKENVREEISKFYCEKVRLIGLVCLTCGVLGIIFCFISSNESKKIFEITRPSYGEESSEYLLRVERDGQANNVKIDIIPKEYTEEEAKNICENAFTKWLEEFCGENDNLNNIVSNVSMPDSVQGYDVNFEYYLSDYSYLDYEGNIDFDNAIYIDGKCEASLTVICLLGDYQYEKKVKYTIIQPIKTLEREIQEEIDKQSKYSDSIKLPKSLNSEKLSYYFLKEESSLWIFFLIAIIAVLTIYIGKDSDVSKEVKKRDEQMKVDYAEIISMFSLLQQTGQSIRNTWNKILSDYEVYGKRRYAYEEMKLVKNKIDNGVPERQAYQEFAKRCGIKEYIKFANIIEQNLSKGSNSMKNQLEIEVYEAAQNKIAIAKKKAEECSTKLLVPMIMMLIIVMAILIVPAFLNMNI